MFAWAFLRLLGVPEHTDSSPKHRCEASGTNPVQVDCHKGCVGLVGEKFLFQNVIRQDLSPFAVGRKLRRGCEVREGRDSTLRSRPTSSIIGPCWTP